ncbi:hypothetical protein ACFU98_34765 [Streptomyces sp. NPDC057575]|uniref:AbiJ-related protein n=1 Tax=unclassified Streptomyces TaxID=2593676 RepID=UPI0036985910
MASLASSAFLPDEPAQRRFVELANRHLNPAGAQLSEHGEVDGYPQFQIVENGRGTVRRPRNLIFAALGKPDIRFSSALDNDIEVAERADQVLVYDRPVDKEGLLWRHLLLWWQEPTTSPTRRTRSGPSTAEWMPPCPENPPGSRTCSGTTTTPTGTT